MASLKLLQYRHCQSLERIKKGKEQIKELEIKLEKSSPKDKNHARHLGKLSKIKAKLVEDRQAETEYSEKVKKSETVSSEPTSVSEASLSDDHQLSLIAQMKSLTQQVETSLRGVEQLVENQNTIREQLQQEQELASKVDGKLKDLDALTERNAQKLNSLQEHLELQKRLNDRLLIVESQTRDGQNKLRKMEQLVKGLPTYQELKKIEESLEAVKMGMERNLSDVVKEPVMSSEEEASLESPQNAWGEVPLEEIEDSSVYVDPILPEEESSSALPWPTEMTDYLNEWVEAHPFGWDHHQWGELLRSLATEGFSEFVEIHYHGAIGHYVETERVQ
jgi:hypothetical protein